MATRQGGLSECCQALQKGHVFGPRSRLIHMSLWYQELVDER